MGKRLFCFYGRDKRKDNQRIRKNAREGRYRQAGLNFEGTTPIRAWVSRKTRGSSKHIKPKI